jgi:tetratricopeptide (TPR) repeat protein
MGRKVGRNEPCPCGSGKKYKRCCWAKDQETRVEATRQAEREAGAHTAFPGHLNADSWVIADDDDLAELSNRVLDLLDQGKLDEAEAVWQELSDKHPDEIDTIERRAMILKARGLHRQAADHYRQAAAFVNS